MPLYEYVCESDGTVLELIRPTTQADAPVDDPDGKGRTFTRKLSVFASKSANSSTTSPCGGNGPAPGTCCPCGKRGH